MYVILWMKRVFKILDGFYFIIVWVINKVEYGGLLVISFCYFILYIVDNIFLFVYEIYNIRYEED